jgi:exopolysaccharide biosynthesis polyprenyl glycosylphosphotransferase
VSGAQSGRTKSNDNQPWGLALSERRLLLLAGDLLTAVSAAVLGVWLWTFTSHDQFGWNYLTQVRGVWLIVPPLVWVLVNSPLYDLRRAADWPATARILAGSAGVTFVAYLLVYFLFPRNALPRLFVLYYLALAGTLQGAWRGAYVTLLRRRPFRRRVLVVGEGWSSEVVARVLAEHGPGYYELTGVLTRPDDWSTEAGAGGLPARARAAAVSEIILATTGEVPGELFQALLDCQAAGIDVVSMSSLYEQMTGRLPLDHIDTEWMVLTFVNRVRRERWEGVARRVFDVLAAAIGLALLAVQLPLIVPAIWLDNPGPILYSQWRMGRGGRLFRLYKFRTMKPGAEGDGRAAWAAPDDPRITRVGQFLRRARLDEAPQLWNVLRGEMSLIGPRPERPEFYDALEKDIPFYRARLLVKPGLTGWAQVNYRYTASVGETAVKLQYDLYYIKHQSLGLDLMIALRTIGVILAFEGT